MEAQLKAMLESKVGHKIEAPITDIDTNANTFVCSKSIYYFELTPKGKVKKGSIKYFCSVSDYEKCIY